MLRVLPALACAVLLPLAALAAKPLGMVTGPQTGTYLAVGRDIATVAKQAGIPVDVKASLGSIDNLRRMSTRTESAGLGIVQSDVLGFLSRASSAEAQGILSKLRLVAPLYTEEVHLLARRDIASVADLGGRRIVVGTDGSGSMVTATNIFALLGIKPDKLYKVAPPEAAVAVMTGQADAALFVGGKPMKLFQNMDSLRKSADAKALETVHFLPLDDEKLKADYVPATLSKKDYGFLTADVPTVSVRALLVAYDFTLKNEPYYHARCKELGRLGTALVKHLDGLKQSGHPKWREVDLAAEGGRWSRDACAWPAMEKLLKTPAPKPVAMRKPSVAVATKAAPKQDDFAAGLLMPKPVDARTAQLQTEVLRNVGH